MTPELQITNNIGLAFDLLDAIMDDPSLLDTIPDGAAVVSIPMDDVELGAANLRMAQACQTRGEPYAVITHEHSSVLDHKHGRISRPATV